MARIPNNQAGFISEAGELHGLKKDLVSQQLEIQPLRFYTAKIYIQQKLANPFRTGAISN
jgi:hypothetical protein